MRRLVLSVAHRLLAQCGRSLAVKPTNSIYSDAALRVLWFWLLMRPRTELVLRICARRWPEGYVRRCWSDLVERQTAPLMHRIKIVRVYRRGPLPPSLQQRNLNY